MKRITDQDLELLDSVPNARENVFRERRDNLLSALDIYEKNVLRGRVQESIEEKVTIDRWYRALLDLEEWAFSQVPQKVLLYVKR